MLWSRFVHALVRCKDLALALRLRLKTKQTDREASFALEFTHPILIFLLIFYPISLSLSHTLSLSVFFYTRSLSLFSSASVSASGGEVVRSCTCYNSEQKPWPTVTFNTSRCGGSTVQLSAALCVCLDTAHGGFDRRDLTSVIGGCCRDSPALPACLLARHASPSHPALHLSCCCLCWCINIRCQMGNHT